MRLISGAATLLVLGALLVSGLPADEKKIDKKDNKTDKTTEKADKSTTDKPAVKAKKKEKFEYGAKFDAKVIKLEGSTKNFSVQITYAVQDPQRVADNQTHYARAI